MLKQFEESLRKASINTDDDKVPEEVGGQYVMIIYGQRLKIEGWGSELLESEQWIDFADFCTRWTYFRVISLLGE